VFFDEVICIMKIVLQSRETAAPTFSHRMGDRIFVKNPGFDVCMYPTGQSNIESWKNLLSF
jgi:hypothetical protein